jgi:hypothetical protein
MKVQKQGVLQGFFSWRLHRQRIYALTKIVRIGAGALFFPTIRFSPQVKGKCSQELWLFQILFSCFGFFSVAAVVTLSLFFS